MICLDANMQTKSFLCPYSSRILAIIEYYFNFYHHDVELTYRNIYVCCLVRGGGGVGLVSNTLPR